MTKEKAIDIELSEIVREFEGINADKIAESFELKTYRKGEVIFHYCNFKHIYFSVQKVSDSYGNGYSLEIDFHQKLLPNKCLKVLKDIEDFRVYFEPSSVDKFYMNFYDTDLYAFFDDIMDLNDHIELDNLNGSDAYRLEKSIVSA